MAVPFYNQVDQDIYSGGEHFIPQERFRLNYTPSTALASTVGNTGGVTGTQAAYPYIWPPQGGGGGGGSGNKFGLDMSTLKTIEQGKWQSPGGPANMYGGEYIKTPRQIAKTEGGIWKDINTNQNVYHGGFNVKTPGTMILDKIFNTKTTSDPYKDSWYGHGEWDEDDMNIGTRRTVPQNIITRWKENREIKKQKRIADEIAAHNYASVDSLSGYTRPQHHGDVSRNRGDHQAQSFRSEKAEGIDTKGSGMHGGKHYAQGGRIGYREGEFVDADVNIEGPGYDVNENVMMASDPSIDAELYGMYLDALDSGNIPGDTTFEMFKDLMSQGPEQDQGLASLV